MKNYVALFLFLFSVSAFSHIGSPDIFYEGNAGPYKIEVTIQPPEVVPGTAKIQVRVPELKIAKISLQPIYYDYGSEGAPKADIASIVSGFKDLYEGKLWLMSFGSSSVKITVEGANGMGSTIVPVTAMATNTKPMEKETAIILAVLGLILFVAFVKLIGSAVIESTLPLGQKMDKKRQRKSYLTLGIITIMLSGGMFFANKWWNAVERNYRENMYKPLSMNTAFSKDAKGIVVQLSNHKWLGRIMSDIVPDHGKLMHLFLFDKDSKTFVHLHPLQMDSTKFFAHLPSLKNGAYKVFADIVHQNGISETVLGQFDLPKDIQNKTVSDADDSWSGEQKDSIKISLVSPVKLDSGKYVKLKFSVLDAQNIPAKLEAYMGMGGHAVVMKKDYSVFIHLHPMGTISMSSQSSLASKVNDNITLCGSVSENNLKQFENSGVADKNGVSMMSSSMVKEGEVSFPYSFPSPGEYIIWVQVKVKGEVVTRGIEVKVN